MDLRLDRKGAALMKNFNLAGPALVVIALATPALSQTKEADQNCNALVEAYRTSEGGHGMQGYVPRSLEITRAMEGCKSGDTANATRCWKDI
jgi:hypothetical protein